jgi:hypothetical protein
VLLHYPALLLLLLRQTAEVVELVLNLMGVEMTWYN